MSRTWWPWPGKKTITPDPDLDRAREQFEQNRAAAQRATTRLIAAVEAEQNEIRRNHLGQLLHDRAFAIRRGQHP